MVIVDYKKKYHKQIITSVVKALRQGKVVAYPTDTSYGLAVDAGNFKAVKKLYKIKGRNFNKPVHIVAPSVTHAKKIARWNKTAGKLARRFWPGPLTLVLALRVEREALSVLSAKKGTIGIRFPKNKIALGLARNLKRPITTTSANLSGNSDCYSAKDIIAQFEKQKHKPDIIINAGKLLKRKPSTVVKTDSYRVTILRQGPIGKTQIEKLLGYSL